MIAIANPDRLADIALCSVLAVALGIGGALMRAPRAAGRGTRSARRRQPEPIPDDLARVDRQLRINMSSARYYHHNLRPMLRELTMTLSGLSLAHDTDFAPLFADTRAPDDPRLRGPRIEVLERIVAVLERSDEL